MWLGVVVLGGPRARVWLHQGVRPSSLEFRTHRGYIGGRSREVGVALDHQVALVVVERILHLRLL